MKFSIKRGTPLPMDQKFRKIKKYLNNLPYKITLKAAYIENTYGVKNKIKSFLMLVANILLTGMLIKYALENRTFIAYGLITVLSMYYINWLIQTIKKPYKNKPTESGEENNSPLEFM